jgi:hypothetical protein
VLPLPSHGLMRTALVTFFGPGVVIYPHGPSPPGAVHHEVSVVIDAATGQYLMGFT